jgi:predicted AAA+ superfamily ATPase
MEAATWNRDQVERAALQWALRHRLRNGRFARQFAQRLAKRG